MNDRYLFKAKRKNWKELPKGEGWVTGNYVFCRKHHYILYPAPKGIGFDERYGEWVEIDESTLCQCTGLKDKTGNLIWEDDVVETLREDGYFVVVWDSDTGRYAMDGVGLIIDFDNCWSGEIEVIGNIIDNPELLEVEE